MCQPEFCKQELLLQLLPSLVCQIRCWPLWPLNISAGVQVMWLNGKYFITLIAVKVLSVRNYCCKLKNNLIHNIKCHHIFDL